MKIGNDIEYASNLIKDGEIVVFPTETVYGIGANALDYNAVSKIFVAKNRPSDNPLIVHISNYEMLNSIVKEYSKLEEKLMNAFWPGPFSIILECKNNIAINVTAGLNTVAVRMPDNQMAMELIAKSNCPIAAPSANISTKPSGTNVEDIYEELKCNIKYFLKGNESKIGIESTVVRVIDNKVHILRPGYITVEDIQKITKDVVVDRNVLNKVDNDFVLSPGMKHKHYSPNTKCIMIKGDIISKAQDILKKSDVCVICTDCIYDKLINTQNVFSLGKGLVDVSKNIYTILRKVDKMKFKEIYLQTYNLDGLRTSD